MQSLSVNKIVWKGLQDMNVHHIKTFKTDTDATYRCQCLVWMWNYLRKETNSYWHHKTTQVGTCETITNNNNVIKLGNSQTLQPYSLFMPQCMLGREKLGLIHKTSAGWFELKCCAHHNFFSSFSCSFLGKPANYIYKKINNKQLKYYIYFLI